MVDLAFVTLLALLACVIGDAFARRLAPAPLDLLDRLAQSLSLGLGAIALAATSSALAGHLDRGGLAVSVGLLAAFALAVRPRGGAFDRGESVLQMIRNRVVPTWNDPASVIPLLGLIALAGTLLTAMAPPTDGDALCYHLQVPKVFLEAGSLTFDADLHETIYPLATEMLYTLALAFRGPVACRLIHWLFGIAFALNVAALARPMLGPRAGWAGVVALLTPAVSNGMGAPMNDIALAAFGNAAIVAVMRLRDDSSIRSALLAGLFAGLAIGVKYPALVLVGVLGLAILWPSRDSAFRDRICLASVFGLATLATGGIWYARAFHYTGNPVYPFFRRVFGTGLDIVLDPASLPMAATPWNVLTALWPMTLDPDRFDSLSHQFGPAFLMFLPALLLEKAPRRLLGVLAIGYVFLTLCVTQRQSMRFVLIAVGPLSVGVAWLASRWSDRRTIPARLLVGVLVSLLAAEAGLAASRARHGLDVALGRESHAEFLTRREPTYRVGEWINENLPVDAKLIGQEHRGFYIPRPYTMELAHRRRTALAAPGDRPEEVVRSLTGRGFTHLLLCPPQPETAVEFDPTLSRALAPWLANRSPLYRESITDPDGVTRLYSIYALPAIEPTSALVIGPFDGGPR
ncbi:glycosyltransferase family 39 protein [Isosphaeraceae bacterium EP7]